MPDFEGKPIRKRGYYRAVKRGVKWAVELSKKTGFEFLLAFNMRNVDFNSLMRDKLNWLKEDDYDAWKGGTIPVPFNKK